MRHSSRGKRHRNPEIDQPRASRVFTGVASIVLVGGIATAGIGLLSDTASDAVAYQGDVAPSAAPTAFTLPPSSDASNDTLGTQADEQSGKPSSGQSPTSIPDAAAPFTAPIPPTVAPGSPASAPVAPPVEDPASTAVLGPVLPASAPVTLDIGIIGVTSGLMNLGLEADGTVSVPPGTADAPAGWYENSPTPGELGSSVILGHVNSTETGVGVFYRLHELTDADQVSVTRKDGIVAVFQVHRVDTYDKASFPSLEVYGQADRAELRLITCGGFDPSTGEFNQNVVAYAHLISSHES